MRRLQLIDYDGINLFYKGKWTTLEFDTVEEGRMRVAALDPLSDEQVEEWIAEAVLNKSGKVWNILKEA